MSGLAVTVFTVIILLALTIGLYLLLSRIINGDGDYRVQARIDDLFITLIGIISLLAVLVWRVFEGTAEIDSPADGKTKAAVILLFLGLWFAAEFVLLLIRLKKEGKTLKEYLHEKFSFVSKKNVPKKEINHKHKRKNQK